MRALIATAEANVAELREQLDQELNRDERAAEAECQRAEAERID
ncbi:MAG TPA: hypothetical protein VHL31_20655 [Geminicoccus sp.]|nr:hypothetical protein [Geminicoccus sp.]HEX2528692.1 hypothetical protein [Geminicoccus sp.]